MIPKKIRVCYYIFLMSKKIKNTGKHSALLKLTIPDGTKSYIELKQQVAKAGIFDREYTYYAVLSIFVFSGFLLSTFKILTTPVNAWLFLWAILFAFFTVQIAGILHDAGHRAVFKSTKWNDVLGTICGAFIADAFNFWKKKHNMHHAHPNQEGADPDVELPLLSFTKEDYRAKTGLSKYLRKYQAFLYYPMGIFVVFSPRFGSIKYLIKEFKPKMWWEVAIFSASFFAWFVMPFFIFDLQKALLLFVIVNMVLGFYLLNVFAPNHKGMPEIEEGVKISFMEQQIMTSRNIRGHWLTDFMYMGLNYQIEHHLFPSTPRNKLRYITPFVLDICKRARLEYTEVSVIKTNQIILSELHQIAKTS